MCRGLSGDNPAESVRAPKPPPDVIHYVESGLDRSFSVSSDVIEERGIPAACRAAVELPKPIEFRHEGSVSGNDKHVAETTRRP